MTYKKLVYGIFLVVSTIIYGQGGDLVSHQFDFNTVNKLAVIGSENVIDKNLVFIGSQGEGYSEISDMQFSLFKELHQKYGYTTLALNTGAFDLFLYNQEEHNSDDLYQLLPRQFSSWHKVDSLVDYIKTHKIKVIGLDCVPVNAELFIDEMLAFLEYSQISLSVDWQDFADFIDAILIEGSLDLSTLSYQQYEKALSDVLDELEKRNQDEKTFYWSLFINNLLVYSQEVKNNGVCISSDDYINVSQNVSQALMAVNLLGYTARFADQKIVVLADISLGINENKSQSYLGKDYVSMWSIVKEQLQDKVFSLAVIHGFDKYFLPEQGQWFDAPVIQGSFESKMNNITSCVAFVSSAQLFMQTPIKTRLLHRYEYENLPLGVFFDGYIFVNKTSKDPIKQPLQETISFRDSISVQHEVNLVRNSIQNTQSEKVRLRTRLLDGKSNAPIAYASVFVDNSATYRVSDQEGYVDLPATQQEIQGQRLVIDALGYSVSELLLKDLSDTVFLEPSDQVLEEIVITNFLSAQEVLKRAIEYKDINHPITPYNVMRYGHFKSSKNDEVLVDAEWVFKEYDKGYKTLFRVTNSVEQIRWNVDQLDGAYKYVSQVEGHRENAIKYSQILHKRKYKHFEVEFVESQDSTLSHLYILAFKTNKKNWNYTNRSFPNVYSGRIYIDRESYAIVKVVENWESTLFGKEIEQLVKDDASYYVAKQYNSKEVVIKEESVCEFSYDQEMGMYVAKKFSDRDYIMLTTEQDKEYMFLIQRNNYLFEPQNKEIEEIFYEPYKRDKTVLGRVSYDQEFWRNFEPKKLELINI